MSRVQIFVSYSRDGQRAKNAVVASLRKAGFDVWVDSERVGPGDKLSSSVFDGIRDSHAGICVVTQRWLDSKWCVAEVAALHCMERRVIPLLEDEELRVKLPEFLGPTRSTTSESEVVTTLLNAYGVGAMTIVTPTSELNSLADALKCVAQEALSSNANTSDLISVRDVESAFNDTDRHGPIVVLLPSESRSDPSHMARLSRLLEKRAPSLILTTGERDRMDLERALVGSGTRVTAFSIGRDDLGTALEKWLRELPGLPSKLTLSDPVQRRLTEAVSHWIARENVGMRRATQELSKRLETFSQIHRFGLERTQLMLEYMAQGVFFIHESDDIYEHDGKALRDLKAGDYYWSTHPTWANPNSRNSRKYTDYIDDLLDARMRQVEIARIYLVDTADKDVADALPEHLKQEVRRLNEGGIRTHCIGREYLDSEFADDFVIIDDRVIGHALPLHGEMTRSRYLIRFESNQLVFDEYKRYFGKLRLHAQEVDLIQNDVDTPAFVHDTHICPEPSRGTIGRKMAVLRTIGCAWDRGNTGCTMCDFKRHARAGVGEDNLRQQLDKILADTTPQISHFELLTLGSFLHDLEVPPGFRRYAMESLKNHKTISRVLIESRAEYVNVGVLRELTGILGDNVTLELGLGVETKNEHLRNRILQKGLSDRAVERVLTACAEAQVGFVGYLLVKPHTLDEAPAIEDAITSAEWIFDLAARHGTRARVAFEPVFITKGTKLETEYIAGRYRLLNLWSIANIALYCAEHKWPAFFGMSDEGLSDARVPRSCPACSAALLTAIEDYNASGDAGSFSRVTCACRADWVREVSGLPRDLLLLSRDTSPR